MVQLLVRVVGVGTETADMLAHEILSPACATAGRWRATPASPARRTRAGRGGGKRGSKAGNARVRRGMIQLAWRFLLHQKDSALARWYRARTADARGGTRKTLIVALARKVLIALWSLVTTGATPEGLVLRPAV